MEKFYSTEIGKIVSYGTHEIVNGMSIIGGNIRIFEREIDRGKEISQDEIKEFFALCRRSIKRSNEGIDYIYENLKKIHDGVS